MCYFTGSLPLSCNGYLFSVIAVLLFVGNVLLPQNTEQRTHHFYFLDSNRV